MTSTNPRYNSPNVTVKVPGRVNLLGEHTDYNHGLVLPTPIDRYTTVSLSWDTQGTQDTVTMYSEYASDENPIVRAILEPATSHWSDYIIGSLQGIYQSLAHYTDTSIESLSFPGMICHVTSTIPSGAGLSSSAALEIGVLKAMRGLCARTSPLLPPSFDINKEWDDISLAKMAQDTENNYIGLPCGLMDQLAVSVGTLGKALMIDFADPHNPLITSAALFEQKDFLVISSGISHSLTQSGDEGYKTRYEQCQKAAQILSAPHLSEISPQDLSLILSENTLKDTTLAHRVQHIVEENARVSRAYQALISHKVEEFARCMNESHISQRDLYEVSIPEIDALVESALSYGAIGARLTGGGFGGSIVALVDREEKGQCWKQISLAHPNATLLF